MFDKNDHENILTKKSTTQAGTRNRILFIAFEYTNERTWASPVKEQQVATELDVEIKQIIFLIVLLS